MPTFTSSVRYTSDGSVVEEGDNQFRLVEQNGLPDQYGTFEITDMYPSANFTFGFDLTIEDDPSGIAVPFIVMFNDTETRLKFLFNHTETATVFSVVMENDVGGATQTYILHSSSEPALYPATATKILIRILNGYLWVKVGSTLWIDKLDIQAHPLHLESGIIHFSVSNTLFVVSHLIENIYFEPIVCFEDSAYFAKSIFAESFENVVVDTDNLRIDPDDLTVETQAGVVMDYIGKLYDPSWRSILGTTVNRADYISLANALGIPVSQSTFVVPLPSSKYQSIETATLTTLGNVSIGGSLTTTGDIHTSGTLTANRVLGVDYNDLDNVPPAVTGNVPTGGIIMWSGGTVPVGWWLCDGTNGTPDLRDRFVIGSSPTKPSGTTGGQSSITLTTANLPSHTHTATTLSAGGHNHSVLDSGHSHSIPERTVTAPIYNAGFDTNAQYYESGTGQTTNSATTGITLTAVAGHTHTVNVTSTGGGTAFDNTPPYYALAFIMKN